METPHYIKTAKNGNLRMEEHNSNKVLTQELQSAVKTIKAAILQSQARATRMMKGFSEESIKLMCRFFEAWKDIEAKSVVGTIEISQIAASQVVTNSVDASAELRRLCPSRLPETHGRGYLSAHAKSSA